MAKYIIRIGPSRDGRPLANPWRIWAQGDEFYAMVRDGFSFGKISFHRNGNWQFQTGTLMDRLARPLILSNGQHHVCQISFLLDEGTLVPRAQAAERVTYVETPSGSKMVLNLLLDNPRPSIRQPAPEVGGGVYAAHRLRSDRVLLVGVRVMEMDDRDRETFKHRRGMKINFKASVPPNAYAEVYEQAFSPTTGNVIVVTPLYPHCFVPGSTPPTSSSSSPAVSEPSPTPPRD